MRRLGIFLTTGLLMACTNTIVAPDDDGTGGAGAEPAAGGSGGAGAASPSGGWGGSGGCGIDCPPEPNAIAYGDLDAPPSPSGSSGQSVVTTTGGGNGQLVHIQLSSFGESCALPDESLPCGGYTRYTLTLPASMVAPGIVYLSHPDVWLSFSETTEGTGDDCGFGGGGGFEEGQLEIFSAQAPLITGHLSGIPAFGTFDPNGEIIAAVCGPF